MGEDTALPMGVAMLGSIALSAVAFGFTRDKSQTTVVEDKEPAA